MVTLAINDQTAQLDIAKARAVCAMLHQAIEAAISDTLIFQFFREKVGLDEEQAAAVLMDFRELRQGTREVVTPH